MIRYFTIGMAGHIDHGKTTLTKALTGVDTDRLKEEKERNISIEPGFAPLIQEDQLEVSIVDVPGHEKFIRQMIAGVAGIDMVMLVIAVDEGMMPQTKEHLDILSLLGIQNGFIVITKVDQADPELLDMIVEDIKENMQQTFLEAAPIYFVDSVSMKGIAELKEAIREKLLQLPKKVNITSFRLPIDQVFTVKGQGAVVRGTIYDGEVTQGNRLKVLPLNKEVRVRQIQSHHQQRNVASKGQRAAINIGGVSYDEIARGDVLVSDDFFSVSDRIDIAFYPLKDIKHGMKQRQLIKLHIGTSEVMGKIIFFDRNKMNGNDGEEVLCQVQLDEKVVVARGDRFILRRPSPVETIGGGWVIEPNAKRYRYGNGTIDQLKQKKEGTATERIVAFVKGKSATSRDEILKQTSISENEFFEAKEHLLEIEDGLYTLPAILEQVKNYVLTITETFHMKFPMRSGINKAEIVSELKQKYSVPLVEFTITTLSDEKEIQVKNQYIALIHATSTLPSKWKARLENIEKDLIKQGAEVEKWDDLMNKYDIPQHIQKDFYYFLIETKRAYVFDEERLISRVATEKLREKLVEHTRLLNFNLQLARESLQLTRKNLVPLLELFDQLGYTKRMGNERTWV